MRPVLTYLVPVAALVMGLYSPCGVAATSLERFNAEARSAYADYRVALFQSNNHEGGKALAALERFTRRWSEIVERYVQAPPEVYAADPEWQPTLRRIGQIAGAAALELQQGRIEKAHVGLEAIRDELGLLRARNSVYLFSDAVNAYHAVMEEILTRKLTAEQLGSGVRNSLRERLGVLKYLAGEMRERAPLSERDDPQFRPLLQALTESLDRLDQALDNPQADALLKAIKGLKPPYARLFLKFG